MEFREYQYKLFIEDDSFSLCDDDAEATSAALWQAAPPDQMLVAGPGLVSVRAPKDRTVRVLVDIRECEPVAGEPGLRLLGECALDVPSGRIVIYGSSGFFPDASRIPVRPALFKLRVYAGSLDTIHSGMRESQDHFLVILWLF